MQRRDFVATTAGLVGLGVGAPLMSWRTSAEPTGVPFLDAHAHIVGSRVADIAERLSKRRSLEPLGADEIIRRMDATGIRKSVVNSTAYMIASDAIKQDIPIDQERRELEGENDITARECARFPDRLVPFLSVNPKRDYAVAEIDRCVDKLGMKGLKLHFWNSLVDTRQPEQLAQVKRVLTHAASRNLPVLAHAFVGAVERYGPDDTERLVKEVIEPLPTLRICFAHAAGAGGFGAQAQQCLERLSALCRQGTPLGDRVSIDFAAVLYPKMTVETRQRFADLVRGWGVERTYWGSDTFETALADSKATWPLSDAEWTTVCRNRGEKWLGA